jgi:nucleoside-diphosphate-sugar epimerase
MSPAPLQKRDGHRRGGMRILVTGATGFIGKNLVKYLLPEGHEVIALVRKTSRTDFLKEMNVPLVTADITDAEAVDAVFRETRPEAVFHCAARVIDNNEARLYKDNVSGTVNICKACYKYDVVRLVYLSSVAVIGGNPQVPLTDDLPYKASNPYGRSKIEAERVVMDFRRKGLSVSIIRPCIVYGEDEPHAFGRVLSLVDSRRIPVLDIPEMDCRLHLVYIDNLVQILGLALEKDEAAGGTFMAADREIITLRKALEILYDELGKGPPPVIPAKLARFFMFVPLLRKKISRILKDRVYDTTRAVRLLGYDPVVSVEEGLRRMTRHWRKTCHR